MINKRFSSAARTVWVSHQNNYSAYKFPSLNHKIKSTISHPLIPDSPALVMCSIDVNKEITFQNGRENGGMGK